MLSQRCLAFGGEFVNFRIMQWVAHKRALRQTIKQGVLMKQVSKCIANIGVA